MGQLGPDDWQGKTAGAWLREQGQSPRMIERFWSVVLVSALGESTDRVALSMARKVFLDDDLFLVFDGSETRFCSNTEIVKFVTSEVNFNCRGKGIQEAKKLDQ